MTKKIEAEVSYIIPKELPESGDGPVSMGDWPSDIAEEARRRGSWPIIRIVWPEDEEIIVSAHAATTALKVANQNAAADPVVAAIADRLATVIPQHQAQPTDRTRFLMTIAEYAERCGYSVAFIKRLIPKGLPTLGVHKARRVHVECADRWMEQNLDRLDVTDSADVGDLARANARKPDKGAE